MTFGLRCSGPACRPHPASLPVRVPTVESLPPASFSFASRLHLAVRLRLPSSAPVGSFHPTRFCPCWAHPAAGLPAGVLESSPNPGRPAEARRGVGRKLGGRPEGLTPLSPKPPHHSLHHHRTRQKQHPQPH